jgi:hypothetical protein
MTLAAALKLMKRENWKPLPWLVMSLALFGAALPAHGECMSPSAAAGATTTTIYRCPEEGSSAGAQPALVDPGNSTEVERGSADVPWFGPKPTRTSDPLAAPQAVSEPKPAEGVAKTEPAPPVKTSAAPEKPAAAEAPQAAAGVQAPEKATGTAVETPAAASAAQAVAPTTEAP